MKSQPLDLPSQAVQVQAARNARRIPLCPLCAEVRRIAEVDGTTGILCPRCGDFEPLKGNTDVR